MKVSKLIATLQELDPTGEVEVVVGGDDITHADRTPGYHDGCYEVLLQYSVFSAKRKELKLQREANKKPVKPARKAKKK